MQPSVMLCPYTQRVSRRDVLAALDQEALHHHAEDAGLALRHLVGDASATFGCRRQSFSLLPWLVSIMMRGGSPRPAGPARPSARSPAS